MFKKSLIFGKPFVLPIVCIWNPGWNLQGPDGNDDATWPWSWWYLVWSICVDKVRLPTIYAQTAPSCGSETWSGWIRALAGLGCAFQCFLFPFFFGGAEILQTYAGQTKSYFWEGKWNDSVVKWPVSASLRTINMSPSNLHILKPCLPYTQVITRLLCLLMQCDVWVCSSPLFALRSCRGSARGFFLPPLLAQGSDTIFSLLPTVCWAGVNKNTPTWHKVHLVKASFASNISWAEIAVFLTPLLHQ